MKDALHRWISRMETSGYDLTAFDHCSVILGQYLIPTLSADDRANIFRSLGLTSKVLIPFGNGNVPNGKTIEVECVQHPDSFPCPMPQGDLTGIYRGYRLDIFSVIQDDTYRNYWDLTYVANSPFMARKFYYFLGELITFQILRRRGVRVKNWFNFQQPAKKISHKLSPSLIDLWA